MENFKLKQPKPMNEESFNEWIVFSLERKILLGLSAILIITQYFIFKYSFPFPNFIPDSYSYLLAGYTNQNINVWPVGYSKFLRLFSSFTNSHTALVFFQYLFLQSAIIYLSLVLAYLLRFSKWTLRVLILLNVINPLYLHVSNLVSSDTLFTGLSIIWVAQLFWLMRYQSIKLYVWHGVVLALTFSVRYNAMYYPIISVVVILLTRTSLKLKLIGIFATLIFTAIFIERTKENFKSHTGTSTFSPFAGWQLASNALFAYSHLRPESPERFPSSMRALQHLVAKHNDSIQKLRSRPDLQIGTYYLWDEQAPLKKYLAKKFSNDSTTDFLKRWTSVSHLYADYGSHIIKAHPSIYLKHFILPNMLYYYVPPGEFLTIYNMGRDTLDDGGKVWFGLESNKVFAKRKNYATAFGQYYPTILAGINVIFLFSIIGYSILNGLRKFPAEALLMLFIWFCNMFFSVLASPIVLRYQVFSQCITIACCCIVISEILEKSLANEKLRNEYPLGI